MNWFLQAQNYSLLAQRAVLFLALFSSAQFSHAHTHNEGALNIVSEDNKLVLSLTLPAHDVIGFERPPRSKEEKLTVDRALSRLKNLESIFKFPETADCKLMEQVFISADSILKKSASTTKHKHSEKRSKNKETNHKKDHKHNKSHKHVADKKHKHEHSHSHDHKDHHSDSSHSDIEVSYMLECKNLSQLKEIQVLIFEVFPSIHTLKTQYVSEAAQKAATIKAKTPVFKLGK